MSDLVTFSNQDGIGVITVNNPPVNALSPGVPEGILAAVQQAQSDGAVKALVLIGSGRTFIAGADIRGAGTDVATIGQYLQPTRRNLPVAGYIEPWQFDAYREVGNKGIQCHGGMGFTWENDLHLYYRRAKASEQAFGDATYHRERIAQLVIDLK